MWLVVHELISLPRRIWTYATLKPVTWLDEERVAACRFPRSDGELAELAERGVSLVVNLHERGHARERLERFGLSELHLPVRDFTPPTVEQLEQGVDALVSAIDGGTRVAVHCGAGLGRTGTLLACYLVQRGMPPSAAIDEIRKLRPGSVETQEQVAAVHAFAVRPRSDRN
jgi:atypical dual specificity phosphatase